MSGFSLIETVRCEPGSGILRGRLHGNRFANSARKLGFAGYEAAWSALREKASAIAETSRLRLELFPEGRFDITAAPFTLQPDDTVWAVGIAVEAKLDSTRQILRHKTSLREIYDAARAEFSRDTADEVLVLNEKGELCEGTITNLFVESGEGMLLTPPLTSGCLAGVLRTSLLCAKKARVQKLAPRDLENRTFYMGNSLRGLVRARLV